MQQIFLYRDPLDTIDSFCMMLSNDFASRVVRKLGLDHPLVLNSRDFKLLKQAFYADSYKEDQPEQATVHKLGLLGFFTMGWVSAMESAVKFHKHFATCLRYEEMLIGQDELIKCVLQRCGFGDKFKGVPAEKLAKIFASDAHGDSSKTASKRFKQGGGRQFIKADEEQDVLKIVSAHPSIGKGSEAVPGTVSLAVIGK